MERKILGRMRNDISRWSTANLLVIIKKYTRCCQFIKDTIGWDNKLQRILFSNIFREHYFDNRVYKTISLNPKITTTDFDKFLNGFLIIWKEFLIEHSAKGKHANLIASTETKFAVIITRWVREFFIFYFYIRNKKKVCTG